MNTAKVEYLKGTEEMLAGLAAKAAEGKVLAEEAIETGVHSAQRAIRKGRVAVEDCMDETSHYIKHHPWQSVSIALGVGVLSGWLLGWTQQRLCKGQN